jgi:DivIVA domain-containing protein
LPDDRAVYPADVEGIRFDLAFRGYRMDEVDEVLDRLSSELAERDTRIAELTSVSSGPHTAEIDTTGSEQWPSSS